MFTSFARRGQRRAFWQSNQQKKDSKGSEEGERAGRGHAFGGGGEGAFEGQANGLSSIVGQGRRRKGREMSVTGYEKENEEDEE